MKKSFVFLALFALNVSAIVQTYDWNDTLKISWIYWRTSGISNPSHDTIASKTCTLRTISFQDPYTWKISYIDTINQAFKMRTGYDTSRDASHAIDTAITFFNISLSIPKILCERQLVVCQFSRSSKIPHDTAYTDPDTIAIYQPYTVSFDQIPDTIDLSACTRIDSKCGYSIVVKTTRKIIDTLLLEYLSNGTKIGVTTPLVQDTITSLIPCTYNCPTIQPESVFVVQFNLWNIYNALFIPDLYKINQLSITGKNVGHVLSKKFTIKLDQVWLPVKTIQPGLQVKVASNNHKIEYYLPNGTRTNKIPAGLYFKKGIDVQKCINIR